MMTRILSMIGVGALLGMASFAPAAAAQDCLEEIVALQNKLPQPPLNAPLTGPYGTQSVGAQLSHDPTPGSVAAAEGGARAPATGAAAYLNKAQNLQAAGDKAGCLQAVAEARRLLEKK